MQQSQNFDLRKSQKQYLDIGNFDEGINNPKKFATGQLIANEDALIDEQHSNPNKSTKTVQQHVYHTENHNNSTNHLKQKSSSNLNEFVIRKLSVNELQSDRSKVRFDSRKCSHENMSNTAKASNLKKKVVKSSRGSTGTAGFHSQKPSNHFETMHIASNTGGNFFDDPSKGHKKEASGIDVGKLNNNIVEKINIRIFNENGNLQSKPRHQKS